MAMRAPWAPRRWQPRRPPLPRTIATAAPRSNGSSCILPRLDASASYAYGQAARLGPSWLSRAEDEPARGRDVRLPTLGGQQRLQLLRLVHHLDDAVLRSVVEAAEVEVGGVLDDVWVVLHPWRGNGAVVDEKHSTTRRQAIPDELPEGPEPRAGHVRKPEGEEHDVVGRGRPPGEDVADDVLDILPSDPFSVEGERLGRGVDDRQMGSGLDQPLRPPAGAACELEHVSVHSEGVERLLDHRDLAVPLRLGLLPARIATLPAPPVVVPRRSCPIERTLLS